MSTAIIEIEAQAVLPMLQVFKEYFDAKYPCTDESNDGSEMPFEDKMKYETYDYLLAIYNKYKVVFDEAYKSSFQKLSDAQSMSSVYNIVAIECQSCQKNNGTDELHSCPYNADINNDDSPCCNCCSDCCYQCALEV